MRVVVPPSGDRYHDIENDSEGIETECGLAIEAGEYRFLGSEKEAKHNGFEKCAPCFDPDGTPSVY